MNVHQLVHGALPFEGLAGGLNNTLESQASSHGSTKSTALRRSSAAETAAWLSRILVNLWLAAAVVRADANAAQEEANDE